MTTKVESDENASLLTCPSLVHGYDGATCRGGTVLGEDQDPERPLDICAETKDPTTALVNGVANPSRGQEDPSLYNKKNSTSASKKRYNYSFVDYMILIVSVLSMSAVGPFLKLQKNVQPGMQIIWRNTVTVLIYAPFAFYKRHHANLCTARRWKLIMISSFFLAVWSTAFVVALDYTTVANTLMLSNCQSILVLIARFVRGKPVLFREGISVIVAYAGIFLCSYSAALQHNGMNQGHQHNTNTTTATTNSNNNVLDTVIGDLVALIAGLGGLGYIVVSEEVNKEVDVTVYLFMTYLISGIYVVVYVMVSPFESITFDANVNHGFWGWVNLQWDRLPLELTMVFVGYIIGGVGYMRSISLFDILIITVAILQEPAVASIMAFFFGVQALPNLIAWLGIFLAMVGGIGVTSSDDKAEISKKQDQHI